MDIKARIERWYFHATAKGQKLSRILIHPADKHNAPAMFMSLPVVVLGGE